MGNTNREEATFMWNYLDAYATYARLFIWSVYMVRMQKIRNSSLDDGGKAIFMVKICTDMCRLGGTTT